MRIIHTADWHLGNCFHGHDRTAEHRHFLSWLLDTLAERKPDALLITGDVFDTPNPSAQAEELLYSFLQKATETVPGMQIVLTAGNHDSAGRIEAPSALLRGHSIYVRGTIHRTPSGEPDYDYYILPLSPREESEAACVCLALPFLRGGDYPAGLTQQEGLALFFSQMQKRLRKSPFAGLPVIAAAHFYATGADICKEGHSERLVIGGQDCVEASVVGRGVCYTALGHIHKAQQVAGAADAFYAGSALPMSFGERGYRHGVREADIAPDGSVSTAFIECQPLRSLLSIPSAPGQAATAEEVLKEIAALPKRGKADDGAAWPYLEIKVREERPEPMLLHDVMEALQDKAAHFCRMARVTGRRPEEENPYGKPADAPQTLTPIDLARRVHEEIYGTPMSAEMESRFKQAESAALED